MARDVTNFDGVNFFEHFSSDEVEQCRCIVAGDALTHEDKELNYKLYVFFQKEMPYGTQKARTGDPDAFILDRLVEILEET